MNNTQLENGIRLAGEIKRLEQKIEQVQKTSKVKISFLDTSGYGVGYDAVEYSFDESKPIIKKHLDWLKYKLENAKLQFSKL